MTADWMFSRAEGASLLPTTQHDSQLCARCTDIDIKAIWSSRSTKQELGPVTSWTTASCRLCNFLLEVLTPLLGPQQQRQYSEHLNERKDSGISVSTPHYLYSMKTRDATLPLLRLQRLWPRMIVLSDHENSHPRENIPYIIANPDTAKPPDWLSPIKPLIDFNQPKKWLQICHELHGEHCTKTKDNIVASLKLIDVTTNQVVKARGDEVYVSLSYVWGVDLMANGNAYPTTVRDAITVTRELGYQFLWVDQYCIDQSDEHDFGDQLQQMDAIYRQAVVTLVAAAGEDANYGLPGVSRTRDPAPSAVLPQGYVSVVRGLPDLSSSKVRWSDRGWCYQEGLLSTKRLVFTDEQLFFECQGFYCVEMLDLPLETWREMHHHENPYILQRYRCLPQMGVFPLDGCGINPWDIYSRISEYSQRSLTHKSDILKGLLGILRAFERETNPLRHLFGIAFSARADTSPNAEKLIKLPTFSDSLRWTLEAPSERRAGFPSWSWTGWDGKISWPDECSPKSFFRPPKRPPKMKIHGEVFQLSVELCNGLLLDWPSFQQHYSELSTQSMFTGIIHIEAWTSAVTGSFDNGSCDMHVHLRSDDGGVASVVVHKTTEMRLRGEDTLLALHFWQTTRFHFLVIKDFGSHWERVAIGSYSADTQPPLERVWRVIRLG